MPTSKNILVAGGAGFIGAQTCKALSRAGYTPIVLDNLSTGFEKSVRWGPLHRGDIGQPDLVSDLVERYQIGGAIHFAASSLVAESVRDPAKYFQNNVGSSAAFLGSLQASGVECVVFSSTAAVYGVPSTDLINESHAKQPVNPYGASKLAVEDCLRWMGASSRLRYTVLRYFNAAGADPDGDVGESHSPETHLIPLACQAALGTGPTLTLYGDDYPTRDGTAVRDYVHVVDLAEAHVLALDRLLAGGDSATWNAGTGVGVTVGEVLVGVEQATGVAVPHAVGPRRAGDPVALVASTQAIGRELGWQAKHLAIESMIRDAVAWQRRRLY